MTIYVATNKEKTRQLKINTKSKTDQYSCIEYRKSHPIIDNPEFYIWEECQSWTGNPENWIEDIEQKTNWKEPINWIIF